MWEQRGGGESEPKWHLGPIEGNDFLASEQAALDALTLQAECFKESALDFNPAFLTPWESARDVPVLARHLGEERLDILAVSYGTHLAMALLKAAPEVVGRAVFCGFEGPDQTWKAAAPFQRQIALIGPGCSWPDSADSVKGAFDLLQREPLVLPDGTCLSSFGLKWMMTSWLGLSSRFKLVKSVCQGIEAADFAPLQKAVSGFKKSLQRPAAFYLNDLASSSSSVRWQKILNESGSYFAPNPNFPFPQIREAWGQEALPDWFRFNPQWHGPLLILTGEHDCFTPTENVYEAAAGFTNMTHRIMPAAAHDQFLGSSLAMKEILQFFEPS